MYLLLWFLDIPLLGLGNRLRHCYLGGGRALISFKHFLIATALLCDSLMIARHRLHLLVGHS